MGEINMDKIVIGKLVGYSEHFPYISGKLNAALQTVRKEIPQKNGVTFGEISEAITDLALIQIINLIVNEDEQRRKNINEKIQRLLNQILEKIKEKKDKSNARHLFQRFTNELEQCFLYLEKEKIEAKIRNGTIKIPDTIALENVMEKINQPETMERFFANINILRENAGINI